MPPLKLPVPVMTPLCGSGAAAPAADRPDVQPGDHQRQRHANLLPRRLHPGNAAGRASRHHPVLRRRHCVPHEPHREYRFRYAGFRTDFSLEPQLVQAGTDSSQVAMDVLGITHVSSATPRISSALARAAALHFGQNAQTTPRQQVPDQLLHPPPATKQRQRLHPPLPTRWPPAELQTRPRPYHRLRPHQRHGVCTCGHAAASVLDDKQSCCRCYS